MRSQRQIALSLGCRIVEETRLHDGTIALVVDCPDHETKLALLGALAQNDAGSPIVRRLAESIAMGASSRREQAERIFDYVQGNVLFTPELGEVFSPTMRSLEHGLGDCDDSARVLFALLASLGFEPSLGTLGWPPTHIAVMLEGLWLETTIPAEFGEHPLAAKKRLGQSGGIA